MSPLFIQHTLYRMKQLSTQQTNAYLIYARRSTNEADNQINSIPYQESMGLDYALKNNLPIADYTEAGFCENGIVRESHTAYKTSGISLQKNGTVQYTIERPKFRKAVSLMMAGKLKGMIFLCWDRASRNDQDEMIIKNLLEQGIDLRFVLSNYDKTSSGALHMDIDGMTAKHYSRTISEKVINTSEKLRSDGKCLYVAPIGYLDEGASQKTDRLNKPLDPERAPLVKHLFELYATGEWSLSQLTKWAHKQGLTSKPRRKKRTQDQMLANIEAADIPKTIRPISKTGIENTLKNPFYIGKLKHKDSVIDGIHQPLISIELFNKVQEVLKSRNRTIRYMDKEFFTYRGLVLCHCGRSYSPYVKKGIRYYTAKCKPDCQNPKRNIRETDIDMLVENFLSTVYFSQEEIKGIESQAKDRLTHHQQKRDRGLANLHTRQRRVYTDLDYLKKNKITLLRTSAMSPEEYKVETQKLDDELATIHLEMQKYQTSERNMLQYVLTFSELIKRAHLYYQNALDLEKQQIVNCVFSELTIYNRELTNIKAKEGYEALFKRHNVRFGSAEYVFSELPDIWLSVTNEVIFLKSLPFFDVIKNKEREKYCVAEQA